MSEGYQQLVGTLMERWPGQTRGMIKSGFYLAAGAARFRDRWRGDGEIGSTDSASAASVAPLQVMGLWFDNPVGVAAGFDRHGAIGRRAGCLGFGHIEIGTLTPRPLAGHNRGIGVLESISESAPFRGGAVLGISIGKSPETPLQHCYDDYRIGLRAAWRAADYIALNLSAAGSAELLADHNRDSLKRLLAGIKREQLSLFRGSGHYLPIAVKIRLDLSCRPPPALPELLKQQRFDGLIAAMEPGGAAALGGSERWRDPRCQRRASALLRELYHRLEGQLPLISVGGIASKADIDRRLAAGAALVQIHNGLIYNGPAIIRALNPWIASEPVLSTGRI